MAKSPAEWQRWVRTHCAHAGLTESDADECVSETLLRYHHRRGVYPWDEPAPDVKLLRLLARNVAHEYQRACARRQRLERDYCALQQALISRALSPEHQAVSNADAERFRNTLPTYLQQTLELLEAGYTPAEIAQRLTICASTVYTYCRDLKARFIEYFGYDPRISGACVVNYSGGSSTSLPNHREEVDDETTADDSGNHSVIVSDGELGSDAPHAGGVERVQWGGGANPFPTMSSGEGCGCSQPAMELSPEKVKAVLKQHREQLTYEPTQRPRPRRRPIIIPIPRIPIPLPSFPSRQPDCPDDTCERQRHEKKGCLPMRCVDRVRNTEYVNTDHWREKFIWKCSNGRQYVWCSGWNPIPGDCCPSKNIPACNGGASGQLLCRKNGVPSQP